MTDYKHEKDECAEMKNYEKEGGCCFDLPGMPMLNEQGYSPVDNLIAGDFPQVMKKVKVTGGDLLPRGAVLGRIHTDDDHCRGEDRYKFLSDHGCNDGSAMPDAILAHTVDTRCGDQEAYVYLAGEFYASEVYLPKGGDLEEVTHILRKRSIFLQS